MGRVGQGVQAPTPSPKRPGAAGRDAGEQVAGLTGAADTAEPLGTGAMTQGGRLCVGISGKGRCPDVEPCHTAFRV